MFQGASGDNDPIHYDKEFCKQRGHPEMLAHGLQVLIQTAAGVGTFPSEVRDTFRGELLLLIMLFMQGLTVFPLTSISHAPQLPVKHPAGISKPAFRAISNQLSPSHAYVSMLFGHEILNFFLFNLVAMKYLNGF